MPHYWQNFTIVC